MQYELTFPHDQRTAPSCAPPRGTHVQVDKPRSFSALASRLRASCATYYSRASTRRAAIVGRMKIIPYAQYCALRISGHTKTSCRGRSSMRRQARSTVVLRLLPTRPTPTLKPRESGTVAAFVEDLPPSALDANRLGNNPGNICDLNTGRASQRICMDCTVQYCSICSSFRPNTEMWSFGYFRDSRSIGVMPSTPVTPHHQRLDS